MPSRLFGVPTHICILREMQHNFKSRSFLHCIQWHFAFWKLLEEFSALLYAEEGQNDPDSSICAKTQGNDTKTFYCGKTHIT